MDKDLKAIESFFAHPDMYIMKRSYIAYASFLNGYDCASGRSVFYQGFGEWLAEHYKTQRNLSWTAAILQIVKCQKTEYWSEGLWKEVLGNVDEETKAIETLHKLVREFLLSRSHDSEGTGSAVVPEK